MTKLWDGQFEANRLGSSSTCNCIPVSLLCLWFIVILVFEKKLVKASEKAVGERSSEKVSYFNFRENRIKISVTSMLVEKIVGIQPRRKFLQFKKECCGCQHYFSISFKKSLLRRHRTKIERT